MTEPTPKANWNTDAHKDMGAFVSQIEYLLEAELLSSWEDEAMQESVTNGARILIEAWHAGTVRIDKPTE